MSEAAVTIQVKKFLKTIPKTELWYWKVSDRFTAGVPDIVGCFCGLFFAIELKDQGKEPRPLQSQILKRINRAKGLAISTDNVVEVKMLIAKLRRRARNLGLMPRLSQQGSTTKGSNDPA